MCESHQQEVSIPQSVRWRFDGHQLDDRTDVNVLRFEVRDINQVIKSSAGASARYVDLVAQGGLNAGESVLPLSSFAVTEHWTPERLAEGTHYRTYRLVRAAVLQDAGYKLWPTSVFLDDVPDPRNDVHYDLIVAHGFDLDLLTLTTGSKHDRAEVRTALAPYFAGLLSLLGEPIPVIRGTE